MTLDNMCRLLGRGRRIALPVCHYLLPWTDTQLCDVISSSFAFDFGNLIIPVSCSLPYV